MRYRLLVIIVLFMAPVKSLAQDQTNTQLWADYHSHYYQNEQREWYVDGGLRTLADTRDWWQVYVRPSLRFHRQRFFDVHAGVGVFYTENRGFDDIVELRPWQGVKFRWPIFTDIVFSHYFRFEQRLSFVSGSSELALRFRYKLSTRIPIKQAVHYGALDPFFMPISAEIFGDAGPNIEPLFGSRGRLDLGLGYVWNDAWVAELHVIAQSSRSGVDERLDTNEYILRLQLKHLLTGKDYRKKQLDLPD